MGDTAPIPKEPYIINDAFQVPAFWAKALNINTEEIRDEKATFDL
jgi:predicted LPLAT superfamily acyltransferase